MGWKWRNVPLPEAHLAGLALGLTLHFILKDPLLPFPWLGLLAGLPLILAGLLLILWAVRQAGDVELDGPARLITGGPYAFSRNPMYLGWSSIFLGLSLALNSLWMLIVFPMVAAYNHFVDIRGEERRLEGQLGDDYRRYRAQVRRYL